jgi:hypothetical protein
MIKYLVGALALLAMLTSLAAGPASASPHSQTAGDYFLSTGPSFQESGGVTHHNVTLTFSLETGASREVFIRDVGRSGPGLQLVKPSWWRTMQVIPPHETIVETIQYHISDCAKVPKGNWPLQLQVWGGAGKWHVITVQMAAFTDQWQQSLADFVCQKPSSSISP